MSFIEENKHFLAIKLHAEMKNLSLQERLNKYVGIRSKVRERLRISYSGTDNKSQFYKEVFEELSDYEQEYLLQNLFYEADCASIVDFLISHDLFQNLSPSNSDSLMSRFADYIKTKGVLFTKRDEINFVKESLSDIVDNISISDWKHEREGENPLIKHFSTWFVSKVQEEIDNELIVSFLLFVKNWNLLDDFIAPFNNTKAILFYKSISSDIEEKNKKDETTGYLKFMELIRNVFDDLFVSLKYIPLLDNIESSDYRGGYLKFRAKLNVQLENVELLNTITIRNSYSQLINRCNETTNDSIIEKTEKVIFEKVRNYEYPNDQEIIEINGLELIENADRFRKLLFEKLYVF